MIVMAIASYALAALGLRFGVGKAESALEAILAGIAVSLLVVAGTFYLISAVYPGGASL